MNQADKPNRQHRDNNALLQQSLDTFRYRLAHGDALPQLAVLGCLSGLLAGIIAIAFRLMVDLAPQSVAAPGQ